MKFDKYGFFAEVNRIVKQKKMFKFDSFTCYFFGYLISIFYTIWFLLDDFFYDLKWKYKYWKLLRQLDDLFK